MTSRRFRCITAEAPDTDAAECALAEAVASGASGAEQRDTGEGVTLLLYAPEERAAEVARAARAVLGAGAVSAPAAVEDTDWSEAWKQALAPVEVSPRLRIRASFEASPPAPGQAELVIDPGQAFGTGTHESTRLALRGLVALDTRPGGAAALGPASRVLDVGTGSGVLALAALRLGAGRAWGLDLDPLAAPAARDNARANGLAGRLALFTGPVGALRPGARFDAVLANLLRRELEPIAAALVSLVQPDGWIVIGGLLDAEVAGWLERATALGLALEERFAQTDASGVAWAGLVMRLRRPNRPDPPAGRSAPPPADA